MRSIASNFLLDDYLLEIAQEIHNYDDSIDIIKKTIEILFSKNYKSDHYDLKRFTRENLTKELAELIISID